jgi:sensor histidine kinase YesM
MKDLMFDLFTPQTYLLLKDVLHTPRFQTTRRNFSASVQEFEAAVSEFMGSARVRALLRHQELRDAYETAGIMTAKASERIASVERTMDRLFASGASGSTDLYRQLQTDSDLDVARFFAEVRETSYYLTNSFESFLSHFISSLERESAAIRRQILLAFSGIAAVIGAATLSLALVFARRISERIKGVEEGVRAVSHGDFAARLSIGTSDEFGALAASFNVFMEDLKRNVDSIQSLMRDVGESLTARPGLQRVLDLIVETAVKDTRADGAAVLIADPQRGLVAASSAGRFPCAAGQVCAWPGLAEVLAERRPLFAREAADGVASLLALPLAVSQNMPAVLCVVTVCPNEALTDLDCTNFGSYAGYAALIIDNFFKYKELLEKREAEYRALQSQIQPHFLYNVLNGLVGLNRMGDARGLEDAIFALKDMLRYILEKDAWTTIGEELKFLGRYCDLQRMRFADRLEVRIRCDPQAAAVRIPKLLLQPVVENAVIHGIEPLDRPGRIDIEACGRDGGRVARVTVADDGAGFAPAERTGRIGLANVRERLSIAFPDGRLAVESSPGAGTRVSLEIPVEARP